MMRSRKALVGVLAGAPLVLAWSGRAHAAPAVTITGPAVDSVITDSVRVTTTISSPYTLLSVVGEVGPAQATMVATAGTPGWSGTVDTSAVPTGPVTLTVYATDALAEVGTATRTLRRDNPPTLSVAMVPESVARPSLRLKATCSDSDFYPCASVTASVGGKVLATGTPVGTDIVLDQDVSFAAYESQAIDVELTATDVAGLKTTKNVRAYVDSSPRLTLLEEVPGHIYDFDATRVLFRDDASGMMTIKERATGTMTALGAYPTVIYGATAALTADGAVWPGAHWRSGVLEALSPSGIDFQANAKWAAWTTSRTLYTRDLTTGVTSSRAHSSTPYEYEGPTVSVDEAANVAVVTLAWLAQQNITDTVFLFNWVPPQYLVTQLTTYRSRSPLVDGTNVVFARHLSTGQRAGIILYTNGGLTVLDPTILTAAEPSLEAVRRRDYRVAGGWTAYTKWASFKNYNAGTRAPDGTQALASPFNGVTAIAGLNALGEVAVDVGTARYLGRAGAAAPTAPLAIGSANGEAVYRDGAWYVVMGRALFRVETGALGGDAGVPDASVADAGETPPGGADASSGEPASPPSSSGTASDPSPASGGEASSSCAASARDTGSPVAALALVASSLVLARRGRRRR